MDRNAEIREIPSLFVTVLRQFSRLMQDEVALAKAEVSRNLSKARTGLVLIGVAAILALVALNVLAGALVGYLAQTGMTAGTAALIVGGVLLIVALILVLAGKSRLNADALAPSRTTESLHTDYQMVKEKTHA